MDAQLIKIAQTCLKGAVTKTMTFPQIVATLMQEGFESYAVDFRRATATYFLPNGDSVELPTHRAEVPIAGTLDTVAVHGSRLCGLHSFLYRTSCRLLRPHRRNVRRTLPEVGVRTGYDCATHWPFDP
jgi:hypothetical protein